MAKFEATGGIVNTYRALLGDAVVDTMTKQIGDKNAFEFLKLHAKYDAISRKNPDQDPLQRMEAHDIPAFDDFTSYCRFLNRLEFTLRTLKDPIPRALHDLIKQMIALSQKTQKSEANTDESVEANASIYGKRLFRGKSLIQVPVQIRSVDGQRHKDALPYSYPSWTATLDIVTNYAGDKHFDERLHSELTATLKHDLVRVIEALPKTVKKTVRELVVEAQQYLMERNWINYGLENVAQASYNIACAGIKHRVTTTGLIRHLATSRTLAYAFLGMNLERVLRRAYVALLKDISNSVVLSGREAGFDVLSCACSYYVQELARTWLDNLQSKLK